MNYTLSDFDLPIPPELIAQYPMAERTASRLLHVHQDRLDDRYFHQLPELLKPGDLLVLNDTRVIRSRIFGHKSTGGQVEILIERMIGDQEALVQMRASPMPNQGAVIHLAAEMQATVLDRDGGWVHLRFQGMHRLEDFLGSHAELPLPPYLSRKPEHLDDERYQTVYAREPGAVAAPTAGLHFDRALLTRLASIGIDAAYLTLHVGAGTFQPVRTESLADHKMHRERFQISEATAHAVNAARKRGGRIVAVGTTALRALESAASNGMLRSGSDETELFITPGYQFQMVDCLITNFHLRKSTLLILVAAFAGYDRIRAAYAHAVEKRYRFFSYGDAMLLEP